VSPRPPALQRDGPSGRALASLRSLILDGEGVPIAQRAAQSLQLIVEHSNAQTGFILLAAVGRDPVAELGREPLSQALVAWAPQRLDDASLDDAPTAMLTDSSVVGQSWVEGRTRSCIALLWSEVGGQSQALGAVVLGAQDALPQLPDVQLLLGIAGYLAQAATVTEL
jgi:hypothetical protein